MAAKIQVFDNDARGCVFRLSPYPLVCEENSSVHLQCSL